MARSFTQREKENIRSGLMAACRQSWTQYGYKKTSVDALCAQAGISKGAFYLFFDSKEALFCEVLCGVQGQICREAEALMDRQPNREGAAEALKHIYRAYDRNNFLYDSDGADYITLMNRLSEEQAAQLQASSLACRQLFTGRPYLKLRVDEELAVSVIYALIMTVKNKETCPHDHLKTFDFMADHLIGSLYEGEK